MNALPLEFIVSSFPEELALRVSAFLKHMAARASLDNQLSYERCLFDTTCPKAEQPVISPDVI